MAEPLYNFKVTGLDAPTTTREGSRFYEACISERKWISRIVAFGDSPEDAEALRDYVLGALELRQSVENIRTDLENREPPAPVVMKASPHWPPPILTGQRPKAELPDYERVEPVKAIAYAVRYKKPDEGSGLQSWVGIWNDQPTAQDVCNKIRGTEVIPVATPSGSPEYGEVHFPSGWDGDEVIGAALECIDTCQGNDSSEVHFHLSTGYVVKATGKVIVERPEEKQE